MARIKFVLTWILIAGYLPRETYSQCDGTKLMLYPGDGSIRFPNYANERGKAANCIWEFSSSDNKEYMLVLTVVHLQMYYVISGEKKCYAGNVLKMNNEPIDCKILVNSNATGTSTFCNAYYSSSTCTTTNTGCGKIRKTSFPVQVKYESDVLAHNDTPIDGFKIEYKYIECPPETSTAMIETTHPINQSPNTAESTHKPITGKPVTTIPVIPFDSATVQLLIVATAVMGAVILILIIVVAIQCKQRFILLARGNTPDATMQLSNIDKDNGQYVNEVTPDEQKHSYACIDDNTNHVEGSGYETPIQMPTYEMAR